jgi:hypothetical protein
MYILHVLFFFGTKDGRVPSVEVKGLKIDPSKLDPTDFQPHSLGPGSQFLKALFSDPSSPTTM